MAIARTRVDERIEALRHIVANLEEYPADQTDDFLAEAGNLTARIKGLADTERLVRALNADRGA